MTDMAVVALAGHGLEVQVAGASQTHLQSMAKAEEKKCRLEQIYDIFAIRVIVKKKLTVNRALGAISRFLASSASRFKDYIAVPSRTSINRYTQLLSA